MKHDCHSQQALTQIHAQEITLEVTDKASGNHFRRTLPLEYFENSNGIRLLGENLQGESQEIIFLSHHGMEKIKDLSGHGPSQSSCDD